MVGRGNMIYAVDGVKTDIDSSHRTDYCLYQFIVLAINVFCSESLHCIDQGMEKTRKKNNHWINGER